MKDADGHPMPPGHGPGRKAAGFDGLDGPFDFFRRSFLFHDDQHDWTPRLDDGGRGKIPSTPRAENGIPKKRTGIAGTFPRSPERKKDRGPGVAHGPWVLALNAEASAYATESAHPSLLAFHHQRQANMDCPKLRLMMRFPF